MSYPNCIKGRCYSPIACGGFGYCRNRNADGLPTPEQAREWERLDNPEVAARNRVWDRYDGGPPTDPVVLQAIVDAELRAGRK